MQVFFEKKIKKANLTKYLANSIEIQSILL